jgi:hypothetical protein
MRFFIPLIATFSVATAAVVRRVVDAAGDVQVSNALSDAAGVPSVSTLTEEPPRRNDVVSDKECTPFEGN